MGLEKTHANDAFVIANGQNQIRSNPYQVRQIRRNNRSLQLNRKGFKPSIRRKRYKYSPGDLIKKKTLSRNMGWDAAMIKDRIVYTVKGVFNYGEWVRLANPITGEKDIDIGIKDVKILKYGSGLLFQLVKSNEHKIDKIEKKKSAKKLSKKDQKAIDMKKQISIDDGWN